MRISDWSSDVCSSDLEPTVRYWPCDARARGSGNVRQHLPAFCWRVYIAAGAPTRGPRLYRTGGPRRRTLHIAHARRSDTTPGRSHLRGPIGRASWGERGCQYVLIRVVAAPLKKKKKKK